MAVPASANVPKIEDPASAYVTARAASISGEPARAAEIYAALAAGSNHSDLRARAVSEAISAGNMALALRLLRQSPQQPGGVNSKLLLVADALKSGRAAAAVQMLGSGSPGPDLSFWVPLMQAWDAADRRNAAGAVAALQQVPQNSALAPFVDEQTAFILLKLGRTAEAEHYAQRALQTAGPREYRVRLALAQAYRAAGDNARAMEMIDGISGDTSEVRNALMAGKLKSIAIDNSAKAFADQLIALALEMRRAERRFGSPLHIVQVARHAAPESSSAAILLGNLLVEQDRLDDALASFRSVPAGDVLKPEAIDAEARALVDAKRYGEALALARSAVERPGATADDYARLGDVYGEMKRHNEAAAAYSQAVERFRNSGNNRLWALLLLQASALESAGRWAESKAALGSAIALAPNEPLILNFLGYSKLEHGEDLDAAEALIRKATELAPDNASITDSLGWALFKRGRVDEAIDVLQQAALADPAQAEIHEHLGDALYSAGRRFEARFAWQAALATAEEEDRERLSRKIDIGLTQATAAR